MTTMTTTRPPRFTDEQPIIESKAGTTGAIGESPVSLLLYLGLGTLVGILFTKAEVVSWFRIQEMFRLQSFHMHGILLTAVITAALSLQVLKRTGARALSGEKIAVPPKTPTRGMRRYWIGGLIFGGGWALLGACPGPVFVLIGNGFLVMLVALAAALGGTWTYAYLMNRLPH
jgi:hypothetical protein